TRLRSALDGAGDGPEGDALALAVELGGDRPARSEAAARLLRDRRTWGFESLASSPNASDLLHDFADDTIDVPRFPDTAVAISRCGDAATVTALRAIATDRAGRPDIVRAYAVLAIGRLCGDFGPLDRALDGLEFRAYSAPLADLLQGP